MLQRSGIARRGRFLVVGAIFVLALGALAPTASAQDLAEQVRQLQQADKQRQAELDQLKASNQGLLEKLESLEKAGQLHEHKEGAAADSDQAKVDEESQDDGKPGTAPAGTASKPSGLLAGYPRLGGANPRQDGFFIKNADETFVIRFHNRLQYRYTADHFYDNKTRNGINSFERLTDRSDFHIAREYFTVNGNAWSKDLYYQVTIEAFTAPPSNEGVRLRYAWVDYNLLHGCGWADDYSPWRNALSFRAGIWKGWFSREFPASDGQMQLVDRALATQAFNEGRIRGVGAFGTLIYFGDDLEEDGKIRGQGRLAYFIEVMDSINDVNQAFGLDTSLGPNPFGATPAPVTRQVDGKPAISARLQYDILRGWYTYDLPDGSVYRANDFRFDEEDDLAWHEEPALQAGGSFIFQKDDFDAQPADNYLMGRYFKGKDVYRSGADLAFKYLGMSLTGEYYWERIVGRHASEFNIINFSNGTPFTPAQRQGQFSQGFYVRGGFFVIPRRFELNGRVSGLFADDIPVFRGSRVARFDPFNDAWEYTLGVTYYPTGHHYLKIQADGSYVRHSPISAEKSEFVAGTHESDLIGRIQLQLEF